MHVPPRRRGWDWRENPSCRWSCYRSYLIAGAAVVGGLVAAAARFLPGG